MLSRIRFPAMAASSLLAYWDSYEFLREYDPEKRLIIAAVGPGLTLNACVAVGTAMPFFHLDY